MQMAELVAYAREKYQIEEQHKWADFPGFSVLCHPRTGKWIALLMRQWDGETGTEIERCDLKCGGNSLLRFSRPYISSPIRMRGNKWLDIAFDNSTERDVVFDLFDQAIAEGTGHGYTIVLGSELPGGEERYQETALPFAGSSFKAEKEELPDRLREMRRLYEYGRESPSARARNFYRQAVFMQDYEDDLPWMGDFVCYFPTYHDLTTRQLRGYFTWRSMLRKGDIQPIATSAAYLYIYELLNGIGAASPEESLQKLREFEKGYLDSGIGDKRMRPNLRRWMLEFAVLHDLSPELARQVANSEMIERDAALAVLRAPENHSDEEVFSALCCLGGKKAESSPVLASHAEKGKALFAQSWRKASAYVWQGKDLFTLCFGEKKSRRWYPLTNAVYYEQAKQKDRAYFLNDCRSYCCRNGIWQIESYEKPAFDKARLQGFLHETDTRLRHYLKTGRYLKESPADAWAIPYIDAVIEEDKKAVIEAARPKITIDLSGLEQIRRDAAATRESLLTEDEIEELAETAPPADESETSDFPLEPVQIQILRALLEERDAAEILKAHHLMPSMTADAINEALFDEIGDTVLLCEEDQLLLVDDYIEELEQILGGTSNGGT